MQKAVRCQEKPQHARSAARESSWQCTRTGRAAAAAAIRKWLRRSDSAASQGYCMDDYRHPGFPPIERQNGGRHMQWVPVDISPSDASGYQPSPLDYAELYEPDAPGLRRLIHASTKGNFGQALEEAVAIGWVELGTRALKQSPEKPVPLACLTEAGKTYAKSLKEEQPKAQLRGAAAVVQYKPDSHQQRGKR